LGSFRLCGWQDIVIRLYEEGLLGQPQSVWLFGETVIDIFCTTFDAEQRERNGIAQTMNGTSIVLVNTWTEAGIFKQILEISRKLA
jgi:hypothetical protein